MSPAPFVVIVDANLLYPFTLRDTVLRAAAAGFFQLRWSREILDEVERNLVENGAMPADRAERLRSKMEEYFPEAEVTSPRAVRGAARRRPLRAARRQGIEAAAPHVRTPLWLRTGDGVELRCRPR